MSLLVFKSVVKLWGKNGKIMEKKGLKHGKTMVYYGERRVKVW
jgi:hypothetical protein